LAEVLETEGATVVTAFDGDQALRILETESFDLLLSDLGMPRMSGTDLIARVRELNLTPYLPAIAVTGYGRTADARRALAAGFDAHLSKPISVDGLVAAVERLRIPSG
jgi:two-component system CheB/CheR fusion protein